MLFDRPLRESLLDGREPAGDGLVASILVAIVAGNHFVSTQDALAVLVGYHMIPGGLITTLRSVSEPVVLTKPHPTVGAKLGP